MKDETKVKKPRAAVKKDKFFLATREELPDGNMGYSPIKEAGEFTTKQAAFQAAKKIPDILERDDVRIIAVSDRITVTKKTQLKFSV